MEVSSHTGGLWGSASAWWIKQRIYNGGRVLVTAPDKNRYETMLNELLLFFGPEYVLPFPEYTQEPFEEARILPDLLAERAEGMQRLLNGFRGIILTTPPALMKALPPKDLFSESIIKLRVNDLAEREELTYALEFGGYVHTELVSGKGEYTLRGDVLEVFPPEMEEPVRIELFDDEIERIESIDPFSRKHTHSFKELFILPAGEALFDENDLMKVQDPTAAEKAENFGKFAGYHWLAPFVYSRMETLFDYIGPDFTLCLLDDKLEESLDGYDEIIKDKLEDTPYALPMENNFLKPGEVLAVVGGKQTHLLEELHSGDALFSGYKASKAYFSHERRNLYQSVTEAAAILKEIDRDDYRPIIAIESRKLRNIFLEFMRDHEISVTEIKTADEAKGPGVFLYNEKLSGGFLDPETLLAVVTDEDIFGVVKRRPKKRKKEVYSTSLGDLEAGDYVVHVDYGIGIYRGLVNKDIGGISGDFIQIEYDGGELLYVPLESIGQIQKYIGTGDKPPRIHNLKSASWKKLKNQAKAKAKKIAIDLLKLYADRKIQKGFAFRDDGELMQSFEQGFEYDETDDQLSSIHDVYQDMEDTKPMERLVCGDVGFGKTEVAMRAAAKAIASGKQVGVLVPTTVLARQHYENFHQRFKDFPVTVDYISRYRSTQDIKKTLRKLVTGEVDIIIGTHRLLSQDVEYKDLGLLIIDEEQRFGVAHKEKIAALKSNIDIIYLSATPIPRTLQLSMSGIRDISVIETPPEERLPVITRVIKTDDEVQNALKKELERGGQVYFLHNRVENIEQVADNVRSLMPHARIAVAHGQMTAAAMEKVLYSFYAGEVDILVCTTIIENGIDIANANTIVINNASAFGLAQIYQLKGRVGRSKRRGYCYMFVPNLNAVNPIARKRLKIIQQLSDLGSGVKIAFYDLQLRGAGNLLGAEQSGFIVKVGYELFIQMIENAVSELKGEHTAVNQTEITSGVPYYIAADYIEDVQLRFDYYRRFDKIDTEEKMNELLTELEESYGELKQEIRNLGRIMLIKNLASKISAGKITIHTGRVRINFDKETPVKPHVIMNTLSRQKHVYKFENEFSLLLYFEPDNDYLMKTALFLGELLENSDV